MTIHTGQPARRRTVWRVIGVLGSLGLAALIGTSMAERRGPALGVLTFLVYGVLMTAGAWSFAGLRRWSARHVLLDRLLVIPLAFIALLLIPVLPWWGAALIAVTGGAVFIWFLHRKRPDRRASPVDPG